MQALATLFNKIVGSMVRNSLPDCTQKLHWMVCAVVHIQQSLNVRIVQHEPYGTWDQFPSGIYGKGKSREGLGKTHAQCGARCMLFPLRVSQQRDGSKGCLHWSEVALFTLRSELSLC